MQYYANQNHLYYLNQQMDLVTADRVHPTVHIFNFIQENTQIQSRHRFRVAKSNNNGSLDFREADGGFVTFF